jgi:hypothetical protein
VITMKVWLLVVYGLAGSHGDAHHISPAIVVDNITTSDQCMKLGARLTGHANQANHIASNGSSEKSTYLCTGIDKFVESSRP